MEYNGKDESDDYPGYYLVPSLTTTLINKQGQVIDLSKNWCPLPILNLDGYPCVNSDNNRQFIHRLLALTFLPEHILPASELDVNHIDGIKSNNALDNLEWVTRSENCLHAYREGLRKDNIPILVKDLRDGTVCRFYSLHECARILKVGVSSVHRRLETQNYGKIAWKYYLLIRDGNQWPEYDPAAFGITAKGFAKIVVAHDPVENCNEIFNCIGDAAKYFAVKTSTLTMHMLRYGAKLWHGREFRFLDDVIKQGKALNVK